MNQIWLSNTRHVNTSALQTQLLPMLDRKEAERLESLKSAQRRKEYLTSRALMRMALSRHYRNDLAHWQFAQAKNSPPRLLNPPHKALYISLSHSGDYVLLAISEQAVGIDIEQAGQRSKALSIAKKVFTPEQQQTLDALPEDQRLPYFYRLWSEKEALVKARHGQTPLFQMISTRAWPSEELMIFSTRFENYRIALASVKPHDSFVQYHAEPFGRVDSIKIV